MPLGGVGGSGVRALGPSGDVIFCYFGLVSVFFRVQASWGLGRERRNPSICLIGGPLPPPKQ